MPLRGGVVLEHLIPEREVGVAFLGIADADVAAIDLFFNINGAVVVLNANGKGRDGDAAALVVSAEPAIRFVTTVLAVVTVFRSVRVRLFAGKNCRFMGIGVVRHPGVMDRVDSVVRRRRRHRLGGIHRHRAVKGYPFFEPHGFTEHGAVLPSGWDVATIVYPRGPGLRKLLETVTRRPASRGRRGTPFAAR
ncbi:MAG: hypothetical protein LUE17_13175 [Planctomycetaceae bacterium]|nr:hypothetical protein [Planctomycetaceae bacterium]